MSKWKTVRFAGNAEDGKAFELMYECLAIFRPQGTEQQGEALSALGKLSAVGVEKEGSPDPDLRVYRLEGAAEVELSVAERDVVLAALEKTQLMTFALPRKFRAVELLRNAESAGLREVKKKGGRG